MARLNEPPQPATESVDALKRRFIRQNREIAKANSTQSLRIRNLENEVSRLLAENVSLREQIIKQHYEIESSTGKIDGSDIDSFKIRLEAKLKEVGDLVAGLGEVQQTAKKQGQRRRKSTEEKSSPKRSPSQRSWNNNQNLPELMSDADGRLPPILEDKQFPRRTLDIDELRSLADPTNLTDSPDLGPPPVAHLEEGEAITFDSRANRRASRNNAPASEQPSAPLSINLETRRRRRESSHSRETPFEDVEIGLKRQLSASQVAENKTQSLKAGAKRKWSGRDDHEQGLKEEENLREEAAKSAGDSVNKSNGSKSSDRSSSRADRIRVTSKENLAAINSNTRKVLGPKNANADPQSPAKSRSLEIPEKPIATKDSLAQRMKERDLRKERYRAKAPVEEIKSAIEPVQHKIPDVVRLSEPETPAPAPLELFSPTSTEPSARQEGRGDTPPPPDLGPDTGTGSFGRASRRPRGSVSYAEPNLRDKMRRPTKELVDAVGAEERARQARAMKINSIESALANIKGEDDATNAVPNWNDRPIDETRAQKVRQKSENTSPLSQKTSSSQPLSGLPPSVTAERRRRTSILPLANEPSEIATIRPHLSNAASTIAALAKPTSKRKDQPIITQDFDKKAQPHITKLASSGSIFDFTGSSPSSASQSLEKDDEEIPSLSKPPSTRSARRHSSVPALSEQGKGSLAISRRMRRESMA